MALTNAGEVLHHSHQLFHKSAICHIGCHMVPYGSRYGKWQIGDIMITSFNKECPLVSSRHIFKVVASSSIIHHRIKRKMLCYIMQHV
eukprot:scaffold1096_cov149-Chaetoceros_neogracile.AAC.2